MEAVIAAFTVLFARILVFALVAPCLPALRDAFHTTYFQAGLGMSMLFAGSMTANLLGGAAIDRWGKRPSIHTGNLIGTLGPVVVAFAPSMAVVYVGMFLIGLSSVSFVAALALISDNTGDKRVLMLNAAHGFMAVVLALVPWGAGFVMDHGVSFRALFQWVAVISLIVELAFPFLKGGEGSQDKKPTELTAAYKILLQTPDFRLVLLGVFFYIGLETGISGWIPLFLVKSDNFSQTFGGMGLMMFWVLMALGRFGLPRLVKIPPGLMVRVLLIVAVLLVGLVIQGFGRVADLLALGLSGLFMSVSFPMFQASVGKRFSTLTGTAFGLMGVMVGLAGTVFPSIMGMVSDHFSGPYGLRQALLVPLAAGIAASLLAKDIVKQ